MQSLSTRRLPMKYQYILCFSVIGLTSLFCFLSASYFHYHTIALLLLVEVSVAAMLFEMGPVLFTAVLTSLIWNFFFIPPIFTFHIERTDDLLFFLLYFVIAMVNAVLLSALRKAERKVREKEEKEQSIRLYNHLFNSVSHELRTPLASLIGTIDTLQENDAALSVNDRKDLLSQMEISASRLNRQVDQLLNMSRVESGMLRLKWDWCDVREMIDDVLDKLTASRERCSHAGLSDMPLVKLDRALMEQVVINLVHNALLYTTGEVKISYGMQGEVLEIAVSDEGPIISKEDRAMVFEKFFRGHNQHSGGSGLGLSIVKGFTEAHGGKVGLHEKVNGNVFVVSIPVQTNYLNQLNHE
jgi:two-component system, OmpR family, sensor histidine kinase KdpD